MDIAKEKRVKVNNNLYYFTIFLSVIKLMIYYSTIINYPESIDLVLSIVIVVILFIKMYYDRLTYKTFFFCIIIGILCLYTSYKIENFTLLLSFVFIVASKGISIDKTIKIMYTTQVVFLFLHIILYIIFGVFGNELFEVMYRENGDVRFLFGFNHANVIGMFILWTILEWLYLKYNKLNYLNLSIVMVITLIFYYFTGTRTLLIVLVSTYLLIILSKRRSKIVKKVIDYIAKYGFLYSSIIFIILSSIYFKSSGIINDILVQIDNLLNYRIIFSAYAIQKFGFTFLGRKNIDNSIPWGKYNTDVLILDNASIQLFVSYGIIYFILISLLLYMMAKKRIKRINIFIIAYVLFSIMESFVMNAVLCFPILIAGNVWINREVYREGNLNE
ncbi:hypothetical protein [Clostridium sp. D43t1_170807_H7]|uniref:hypothetical protein n=1 Tax=Clostridium sp. D43t1_170807_H7 TaxID=2787140 RepID=UPI001898E74D|nr:hypothetical protein [Clostridium sp. D43t1_170807_H7]